MMMLMPSTVSLFCMAKTKDLSPDGCMSGDR